MNAVLSMETFQKAIDNLRTMENRPRKIVLHPERYKDFLEMQRYCIWFSHLLKTSYKAWDAQKHDGRWSKRTKQRRYVQWCEKNARIAASMELEI